MTVQRPRDPHNRTTGPTPLPPAVLEALGRPIVSHRSPEFQQAFGRVTERVQALVGTRRPPMFLTCSGTGGLEAAILNTLTRDDRVLAVSNGYYGDLFAAIAQRHLGRQVVTLSARPGEAVDRQALADRLQDGTWDAVLVTHSESSTGVLNPLAELASCIRAHSDALVLVDAISSVGTTDVAMDDHGVDVLVTVTQKGLMSPPGLAIVCASARAMLRHRDSLGSFYFDFERALSAALDRQTPSTPALTSLFGLDAALAMLEQEGLQTVYRRHARLAAQCRAGARDAGLSQFAAPGFEAPGITAMYVPEGISSADVQRDLAKDFNLLVTPALASWRERVIRIGHMGWVSDDEIRYAVAVLQEYFRRGASRARTGEVSWNSR